MTSSRYVRHATFGNSVLLLPAIIFKRLCGLGRPFHLAIRSLRGFAVETRRRKLCQVDTLLRPTFQNQVFLGGMVTIWEVISVSVESEAALKLEFATGEALA